MPATTAQTVIRYWRCESPSGTRTYPVDFRRFCQQESRSRVDRDASGVGHFGRPSSRFGKLAEELRSGRPLKSPTLHTSTSPAAPKFILCQAFRDFRQINTQLNVPVRTAKYPPHHFSQKCTSAKLPRAPGQASQCRATSCLPRQAPTFTVEQTGL